MAEELKKFYNANSIAEIGNMLKSAHPSFDASSFALDACKGLEELELMPRAEHIARAMIAHLPPEPETLLDIITRSLPDVVPVIENHSFDAFVFAPHTYVIRMRGLHHFDAAMRANYEITQRFTAEFSVRPFLEYYPDKTLELFHTWVSDPSHHVRRLVSEGSRPRLPWASRLTVFKEDPTPVIELLERLKDDESLYVRRSVANNLNDIGKDHPRVLSRIAKEWLHEASSERTWLVHHAVRTAVKRGDTEILELLGYGSNSEVEFHDIIIPKKPTHIGECVRIAFTVVNPSTSILNVLVDLRLHFVKANGELYPKVFKLGTAELLPGGSKTFKKSVSIQQLSTRTHYPGEHLVEAQVNGKAIKIGTFDVVAP